MIGPAVIILCVVLSIIDQIPLGNFHVFIISNRFVPMKEQNQDSSKSYP